MPIVRPQHANARHHGWAAELDDEEQRFYRGLALLDILLGPWEASGYSSQRP